MFLEAVTDVVTMAIARTTKPTKRYRAAVDSPKSAVVIFVKMIGDRKLPTEGDTTDTSAVAVADVDLSVAIVETMKIHRGSMMLSAMPTMKTATNTTTSDEAKKLSSIYPMKTKPSATDSE